MTLYPNGYGTGEVTLDRMRELHGGKMHPEFARRFFAYIEAMGGRMGVGGGWRSTQPVKPGFAPDGQSFHQDQRFASGMIRYAAVDLVHRQPGQVHRSPSWAETATAPDHALHTFITGEPWHIQCIEMRGWQSWVNAGRPDPITAALPGDPLPDPPLPPPPPPTIGDDLRPIITTWQGEQWPILAGFDPVTASYTWRGIPGDQVDGLIAAGAATDGRATPWPAAWKTQPWMTRLG